MRQPNVGLGWAQERKIRRKAGDAMKTEQGVPTLTTEEIAALARLYLLNRGEYQIGNNELGLTAALIDMQALFPRLKAFHYFDFKDLLAQINRLNAQPKSVR